MLKEQEPPKQKGPSLGTIIGRLVTGSRVPLRAPSNPLVDSFIYGVDDVVPGRASKGNILANSDISLPTEESKK